MMPARQPSRGSGEALQRRGSPNLGRVRRPIPAGAGNGPGTRMTHALERGLGCRRGREPAPTRAASAIGGRAAGRRRGPPLSSPRPRIADSRSLAGPAFTLMPASGNMTTADGASTTGSSPSMLVRSCGGNAMAGARMIPA